MSFVTAAPEEVQAAARNLEGIRSLLAQSSASAAAPTAGVVAAAEDQVSAQVAAFFGAFGQEYQVISAQAQAFHEQFVNLVSAGAGAYLSTELANAQQNLLDAVNGPVQGLLGQSAGASRAVGAAASGLTAARTAALPLLGGATSVGSILGGGRLGSILGTGAPVGQSINGVVTALENGSAVSLLSGQIGAASQSLSGGIAGLPTALSGLVRAANADQALTSAMNAQVRELLGGDAASRAAATTSATTAAGGSIFGRYESLLTNTVANLQSTGTTWTDVTAPALLQAITTHANAQPILTALATGNSLPMLTATGQFAQCSANLIQNLKVPVSLSITSLSPSHASVAGLPELLAFDALGAPVNAALVTSSSNTAILNAVQTGNPLAAMTAVVDAPANIANAFLNGEQTVSLPLPVPGLSTVTADLPFSGLLVPVQLFATTTTLPGSPLLHTVTITGPPVGGLVPALLDYTPQLLASAFGG